MNEGQKTTAAPQSSRMPHRKFNTGKIATTVTLAVIVIAIIAYLALSWHGVPVVSLNQTVSLALGKSSYFKLKGQSGTFAMFLQNSSSKYSVIYMSEVPVLTNPISELTLYNGSQLNASTSLSPVADLAVKLLSSGNTSAKVVLTLIPAVYGIKTSPSIIISNPASFYSGSGKTETTPASSAASVTPSSSAGKTSGTSSGPSSSTSGTSTTTTSAISPVKTPIENISSILNYTYIGSLMHNYSILYSSDKACTSSEYNTSFLEFIHQSPTGPSSFKNVSAATPAGFTANATVVDKNNYLVIYLPMVSAQGLRGTAVSFNLDSSTATITNLNFNGIYQGLNYTSLLNSYRFQKGLSGSCGAYMPYIP